MNKFLSKHFWQKGDRYTGLISTTQGRIYSEFSDWLDGKLKEYAGKTVTVTIQIAPQQDVKVIERVERHESVLVPA